MTQNTTLSGRCIRAAVKLGWRWTTWFAYVKSNKNSLFKRAVDLQCKQVASRSGNSDKITLRWTAAEIRAMKNGKNYFVAVLVAQRMCWNLLILDADKLIQTSMKSWGIINDMTFVVLTWFCQNLWIFWNLKPLQLHFHLHLTFVSKIFHSASRNFQTPLIILLNNKSFS